MLPVYDRDQVPHLTNHHVQTAPPFITCCVACQTGDLHQVRACLAQDPSLLSQCDSQGQTLMHIAAEQDHIEVVKWLYNQDPSLIDVTNKSKLTPLHLAAFQEQIPILKVFAKKLTENTPLILQIAQKRCPKTLAFILEQGVDPQTINSSKQTLLHLAAEAGQERNVRCLLQHEVQIDPLDLSKRTPLFLAVIQGHRAIVKLLIKHHAKLTTLNEEQETLLHLAAFYGHTQLLKELLEYPKCKDLLEVQDQDGKTPLHKAVWGDPKPNIVKLLLEHNANPHAKNHYGYTPLHWAAKHGHTQSARSLLRAAHLVIAPNANNHLPFDLAIHFDQDDFIHFFLETQTRLIKKPPSSDIEGYYFKCLLQAKEENLVEEQILYLLKLSHLYTEKENLLVGAKILNCAFPLLDKKHHLFKQYLFKKLEEIEKLFLEKLGIKALTRPLETKRIRLADIRKTATQPQPIQKTLRRLTREFMQLLTQLITETQEFLGPPPVKWAAIGMGSMSRGEMCPYSDIEFAFVIEKDTPKALEYFRTLSKILELKIINLGETKFPIFGGRYESPTPDGFSLDSAGNSPLGVTGVYELIGTPKQLAQFQSVKFWR